MQRSTTLHALLSEMRSGLRKLSLGMGALLLLTQFSFAQFQLQITEIFNGQSGDDLTADWFEIQNTGDATYNASLDGQLFYDDESMAVGDAAPVMGVDSIPAGGFAIVLVTDDTLDVAVFKDVWGASIDLMGLPVGYSDGAGLGGGGDVVALWIGDPTGTTNVPDLSGGYPDAAANDGQTYDLIEAAFSMVGTAGAVRTFHLGGDGTVPNIGSPGNGMPKAAFQGLKVTEIFSGQSGDDLTADWFEITNMDTVNWVSGVDSTLYYDDESANILEALPILGLNEIPAGKSAIVVIGVEADAQTFVNVWKEVADLDGVDVGHVDGSGLGGGGDAVTLWAGTPGYFSPADFGTYPDASLNDGQTFDIELDSFSVVGNSNMAVQTILMGGAGDVPNIGSPGNQGPSKIDPNAPVIMADVDNTVPQINLMENAVSYVSMDMLDNTDPSWVQGIEFDLSDPDGDVNDLTIWASSDNSSVLDSSIIQFTQTGSDLNVKVFAAGTGYANLTIWVEDLDGKTDSYTLGYAVSEWANSLAPTTRFYAGASDGSTAITTGTDFMWVADDEGQTLRLYDIENSGYPVKMINFDANVGDDEIDIEGSFRKNDTIYWMGSHTNAERDVIFRTIETGSGATSDLTFAGHYGDLMVDLINWDENDGHGKGAGYYGFASGFEIEGLSADPNNPAGALIAFRGPLVNGNGLLIPVDNFQSMVAEAPVANSAVFGDPIELDLERHSIRSIECNEFGCLVIGGPVATTNDFRLFTWTGNPLDAPELREADIMAQIPGGSYEGIIGLPGADFLGANGDATEVKLLVDMGTFYYYGDQTEAKDLPHPEWKKARSERIALGAVEIPPVAYEGDIVITEILQNPSAVGDNAGEWFELYNTTPVDIDLEDWTVSDNGTNSFTISGTLIILSGEYLILGVSGDSTANGGVQVDYDYPSTFAIANGDDEIILRASDGVTIDSVAYDGGPNFPDPNGASMQLLAPNLDNNDGANWCEASIAAYGLGDFGTPGMANDCPLPPAPVLKITEIFPGNANGENLTADWIEITNFGEVAWISGVDGDLYYDDESQAPADADLVSGITEIQPGASVIVMIGTDADVTTFEAIWSSVYDLTDVEIGYADGAGLSQGGDGATIFVGGPTTETIADFASYPSSPAGQSYDVMIQAFSEDEMGLTDSTGTNVAAASIVANNVGEYAIASPGNKGPLAPKFDIQITEIFNGQAGDDLTADWFEIMNVGNEPWIADSGLALYYDDESAEPLDAVKVTGIDELAPGESAIVILTEDTLDVDVFWDVWSEVIDLRGVAIGWADGAGLGGSGDMVVLWVGDPNASGMLSDSARYPDAEAFDGQSFDVELGVFSVEGNDNGAVTTISLGGDLSDVPNVGSPGNGLAFPSFKGLMITEIFSGQAGTDLTADWFEIKNGGTDAWIAGSSPDLFYDDESADALDADPIIGVSSLDPGEYAIVVVGGPADTTEFRAVWGPDIDLNGVQIGFTDGAGLGGGGDIVTLWAGDPNKFLYVDTASYPDTELNDGQSWDVELEAFSTVGNANGAVATTALGGNLSDVPNVGSPGNKGVITGNVSGARDLGVVAFPNPLQDLLMVKAGSPIEKVAVMTISGAEVLETNVAAGSQVELNIAGLETGIYFLMVTTQNGTAIQQVTKR